MTYEIYLDLSFPVEGGQRVDFHIPDKGGTKNEPEIPLPFGAKRLRVEIDIPHPYRPDGLMVYIEQIAEGLLHLPKKGGKP